MLKNTSLPERIKRDEETGLLQVSMDLSDQQYMCLVEMSAMLDEKPETLMKTLIREGLRQIKSYAIIESE